jgi:photosystem II stability/assembly factor-like uncharacterized protein
MKNHNYLSRALVLCLLFFFMGLNAQTAGEREKARLQYEQTTLKQYAPLPFFDIPWRVIFNDGELSYSAVSQLFRQKMESENINLLESDPKLRSRWLMYQNIMESRQTEDGKFRFQDQVLQEVKTWKQNHPVAESSTSNFQFIGQSNSVLYSNNGRIERVNFHPTNTNIIWASAPEGGLWKSTDAGQSWSIISDFWEHLSMGDLVYDPNNYNILYAATDDHDSWFNANRGVLKSIDGGNTWFVVGLPYTQATEVWKLLIHPSGSPLYACTKQGLFESTDGGVNWSKNMALPADVNDLEFHPSNSQIMYATTRGGASPNFGYFYVSTNGGSTFTQKTMPMDSKGRTTEVCVSPDDPNIAYVGIYPEPPQYTTKGGMLMKYTHSTGMTTIQVDQNYEFPNIWVGGAWNFRVEVDPGDADHVFYGSVLVYESFDGGQNWSFVPSPHADIHDMKWQPGTNRLWFADDGGLGYTTNGGADWITIRDLPVMQWTSVKSNPTGTVKILGAQDAGVHIDHNGNWFRSQGGDGLEVRVDPVDENIFYGSIQLGGNMTRTIYDPNSQSHSTSTIMNQDIAGGYEAVWRQKILIDPTDRNTLLTNYRDIFKSIDAGASWTNISNGSLGNGDTPILFLYQSPSHPNILIAGWVNDNTPNTGEIRKSTDGGVTWNTMTHPGIFISDRSICFLFHPTNPDKMWVSGWSQVKTSDDGGNTWTDYTGSLPWVANPQSMAYHEGTPDGIYIGGRFGNLYYRDNTMSDWVLFNNNLPNVWIREVEVLPQANKVRVATWGRGVWESPTYATSENLCVKPLPPVITIDQCSGDVPLLVINQATPAGYTVYWYKDGTEIPGENGTSLTSIGDGFYQARYLDDDGTCHSYFSDRAEVTSLPEPVVNGGPALDFDGDNDYVSIPGGSISVSNNAPFTIEFWAKRGNTSSFDYIVSYGNYQQAQHMQIGYISQSKMAIYFVDEVLASPDPEVDQDWVHWAFVYDPAIQAPNDNCFMYKSGNLLVSNRADSPFSINGEFRIARNTNTDHFGGALDEFKVWNKALSPSQIQEGMYCPPACINEDLELYLPFEDGTPNGNNTSLNTVTDYSLNKHTANLNNFTLSGSASNFVDGINNPQVVDCGNTVISECDNHALDFDGINDYVALPEVSSSLTGFTFEAWYYYGGDAYWQRILDFNEGSSVNMFLTPRNGNTGTPRFAITTAGPGGEQRITSPDPLVVGNWYHFAVVYDDATNTGTLYINGDPKAQNTSMTLSPADLGGVSNHWLGRSAYGADPYLKGKLDEVRIWDYPRTEAEIFLQKNRKLSGYEPSLIAYYHADQGIADGDNAAEGTLYDFSEIDPGNDQGTLMNFALNGTSSNWTQSGVFLYPSCREDAATFYCTDDPAIGDPILCDVLEVEDGFVAGNHVACEKMITSGSVIVDGYALFAAKDELLFRPGFEVSLGNEFETIMGDFCGLGIKEPEEEAVDRSESLIDAPFQREMAIKVIPNPFSKEAQVHTYLIEGGDMEVLVSDSKGTLIYSFQLQGVQKGWNNFTLRLDNESPGLYFLTIKSKLGVRSSRIILAE